MRFIRGLNWRVILFIGIGVALFVYFGLPKLQDLGNHRQASTVPTSVGTVTSPPEIQTTPNTTYPTTTPGTTNLPPTRGGKATSTTTPAAQMAAVNAAAFQLDQLYKANFYAKPILQATVDQYVVPNQEYRTLAVTLALRAGTKLAMKWGYKNKQETSDFSQPEEHTFYYRVDSYKPPVALIRLVIYEKYREVSPQLRQLELAGDTSSAYQWSYTIPRTVIVTMYRWKGRWYYCYNLDAPYGPLPKGGQPTKRAGLNLDQTMARFTPYLQKGFQPYATAP